jgi:hypothetical protein
MIKWTVLPQQDGTVDDFVYESLGLKCLEMPLEHGIMGSQHFGMLLDFIF